MTDEEYEAALERYGNLVRDLVDLTIDAAGGFVNGSGWINVGEFTPGDSSLMVDARIHLKDVKVLQALFDLPSMHFESDTDLEAFDWVRFEALRDRLRAEVEAREAR